MQAATVLTVIVALAATAVLETNAQGTVVVNYKNLSVLFSLCVPSYETICIKLK